jgi:integrase/recombinase XerD
MRKITLGHPLLDDYLVFVAARARTGTWLAVAYDLKGVLRGRRQGSRPW